MDPFFDCPLGFIPKDDQSAFFRETVCRVQRTGKQFNPSTNQNPASVLLRTRNFILTRLGTQVSIQMFGVDAHGKLMEPGKVKKQDVRTYVVKVRIPHVWLFEPNACGSTTIKFDVFMLRMDEPSDI